MKPKIIHFQIIANDEGGEVVVLLDNGRIFKRTTSSGGPYYWTEVTWMEDMVKYFGEDKIKNKD